MSRELPVTTGYTPRVSIAVLTRGGLPLMQDTLSSVLAQNLLEWELIIIDDGSTDSVPAWLTSLSDSRVRILRADRLAEGSVARNRALAIAQAPYILFLDDGDRLAPGALRCLLAGAKAAPDAVAVIGRRALFDARGRRRLARHPRRPISRLAWTDVLAGWASGVGATLYRADAVRAVGGWDGVYIPAEDQYLLLRVSSVGPLRLVPGLTLEQRVHPVQRRAQELPQAERQLRDEFLAPLDGWHRRSAERIMRGRQAGRAGDEAIANRCYRRAATCYLKEALTCPELLWSLLVGPRLAAQATKAAVGSCLGRRGAVLVAAAKARTRMLLGRAPGEYGGRGHSVSSHPGVPRPVVAARPPGSPAPTGAPVVREAPVSPAQSSARPVGRNRTGWSRWSGLRTLFPGSLANLGVQGLLLMLGLFSGVVTARVLGPALRGEFSLLVLVPSVVSAVGSLGMEYGVYYLWHEKGGRFRPELLAAGAVVASLSGLAFGAAGFAVVSWLEPKAGLLLWLLVAASMPMMIANTILTMALVANRRVIGYNVSRLAGPVTYTGAIAFLWAGGALGVASAFMAWFGSAALTVVTDVAMVAWLGSGMPRWNGRIARRSAGYGLRSYVGTVAQYGTLRLDQGLLVGLAGNGALGLYYAAVSLGEALLYLANNVSTAMMAQLGGRSRAEQRHLTVVAIAVVGAGTAAAAAVLTFVGGHVIVIVLGRVYLPGVTALQLLLPGIVFLAVARVMNSYFITVGEARIFARAAVASMIVMVVGGVVLIPAFHARGAALASTLAYGVMVVRLARMFRADRWKVSTRIPATLDDGDGIESVHDLT